MAVSILQRIYSKQIILIHIKANTPGWRQAIIWINAGLLLIGPLGANLRQILIEIYTFSFKKLYLKISSGKCWAFCLVRNVLWITQSSNIIYPTNAFYSLWTTICLKLTSSKKFGVVSNTIWIWIVIGHRVNHIRNKQGTQQRRWFSPTWLLSYRHCGYPGASLERTAEVCTWGLPGIRSRAASIWGENPRRDIILITGRSVFVISYESYSVDSRRDITLTS